MEREKKSGDNDKGIYTARVREMDERQEIDMWRQETEREGRYNLISTAMHRETLAASIATGQSNQSREASNMERQALRGEGQQWMYTFLIN